LSTAAKKRAITSQPTKVLTCHRRKSAPSTAAVVSRAAATVRITWEVGAPAHPRSLLGVDAFGSVGAACGPASAAVWGFACSFVCWLVSLVATESSRGFFRGSPIGRHVCTSLLTRVTLAVVAIATAARE